MENFMDKSNAVVLQGHLTNVTKVGDKMVLFGFEIQIEATDVDYMDYSVPQGQF